MMNTYSGHPDATPDNLGPKGWRQIEKVYYMAAYICWYNGWILPILLGDALFLLMDRTNCDICLEYLCLLYLACARAGSCMAKTKSTSRPKFDGGKDYMALFTVKGPNGMRCCPVPRPGYFCKDFIFAPDDRVVDQTYSATDFGTEDCKFLLLLERALFDKPWNKASPVKKLDNPANDPRHERLHAGFSYDNSMYGPKMYGAKEDNLVSTALAPIALYDSKTDEKQPNRMRRTPKFVEKAIHAHFVQRNEDGEIKNRLNLGDALRVIPSMSDEETYVRNHEIALTRFRKIHGSTRCSFEVPKAMYDEIEELYIALCTTQGKVDPEAVPMHLNYML